MSNPTLAIVALTAISTLMSKFISYTVSTYSTICIAIGPALNALSIASILLDRLHVSIDSGYIFILKPSVVDQETRKNFSASVIIP